jgi:hypothetical protein
VRLITKIPVILTIFIVFLTGMIPAYHQHQDNQLCKNASKAFIEAVINNDLDSAKNLSCGKISWQLQNAGELPESHTISVMAQIISKNNNTARVLTVCEMEVESRQDVAWYELYLIKDIQENAWKVYKIQETLPDYKGPNTRIIDAEIISKAFILSKGQDASNYLAGPALKAYQQIPSGITEEPQHINLTPLQTGNKTALYKASYTIQDRQVEILLHLYKLDAWHIVSINQL